MSSQPVENASYAGLESILNVIAQWVRKYRYARGIRDELMNCGPDEVANIARGLGVSPSELVNLASKGPEAATSLQKMLLALGVDPKSLASDDPIMMRDLQRLCIACGHKRECEHDLAAGTAAENYRDYCPNAYTLDDLFTTK
jgi:transcriptional regulator with XRE-family HTH domain